MIKSLRDRHPDILVLEAGDLLFPRLRQPGTRGRHLDRARFIIRSLGALGVDAWCPSALDLNMGMDELRRAASEAGLPLISANLEDAHGKLLLPSHLLMKRGGLHLAVVGLSGPWPKTRLPEGFRLTKPGKALERVKKTLNTQVDLIIVLSSLGIEADQRLAQTQEGPHLFLGAGDDRMVLMPRRAGDSLLLQPYKLGEYLGLLRLNWRRPLMPILDSLEKARLQRRLDKTPSDSPEADRLRQGLKHFTGRSLLRAVLRPLSESDPQDPKLREAISSQIRREAGL
ncbi:MAG: hypothetical protein JRF33_09510 [Deltaproteobacteria bacterium]|nr:hypothetical protein [Deltaproteobacteria bacterium]